MATLTQADPMQEGTLVGLRLPVKLRTPKPLSDAELMAFSRRNRPYRVEQNARGEIEIMTPVGGKGSRWEATVIRELGIWAEQHGGASFS